MDTSSDDSKRPRMDGGDSGGGGASRRQGLLAVNDLTYLLEPDLSVAVNITHKNHFFQSTDYTDAQRAVCILNSGADYIDTRDSYLQFEVQIPDKDVIGYFGAQGSALNLIKTVTVSTRSGDEISRIVDCNRLNAMINSYRFDKQWVDTVGQSIGFGRGCLGPQDRTQGVGGTREYFGGTTVFAIPLYLLTDFFGYGRLLPSMIMSGLRIEIEWEKPSVAFVSAAARADGNVTLEQLAEGIAAASDHNASKTAAASVGSTKAKDPRYGDTRMTVANAAAGTPQSISSAKTITSYNIKSPVMVLKSVQLTDATQRALNELSATNGLEIVYTDYERTETSFGTSSGTGNYHVEVRKACSRALQAFARVRVSGSTQLGAFYESKLNDAYWKNLGGPAITCTTAAAANYKQQHFDSFASEPLSQVTSYQWQLGSLYFPQQPIKGTDAIAVAKQGYADALIALNKYGPHKSRPHVPLANFDGPENTSRVHSKYHLAELGTHVTSGKVNLDRDSGREANAHQLYEPVVPSAEPGTFLSYGQTWVVSLERSTMFELAGVPINNSRVLALRMESDSNMAQVSRTIDVYLKYVKLARVFLNNVEVEQ